MSTISVALSKSWRRRTRRRTTLRRRAGVRPSGVAAAAKLFIVAAGDAAAIDTCQPLFDAMGQKTTVISEEPQPRIS